MSALAKAPDDVFFFGPPNRQMFGALEQAATYAQRENGVVICAPFGHEYVRSHRACRHLAFRLSQAGFPVLRFDYSFTGDSQGDGEDASLETWRDDIGLAISTLKDRTDVETVCLVGLRLGATLAYQVAQNRNDVDGLVLWEPILDGHAYLRELGELHRDVLWRFFDDAHRVSANMNSELIGFPVSDHLRSEFEQVNLLAHQQSYMSHTLIVDNHKSHDLSLLLDAMRANGTMAQLKRVPSFTVWREDVDKGLVPDEVLRTIVTWASEVLL